MTEKQLNDGMWSVVNWVAAITLGPIIVAIIAILLS